MLLGSLQMMRYIIAGLCPELGSLVVSLAGMVGDSCTRVGSRVSSTVGLRRVLWLEGAWLPQLQGPGTPPQGTWPRGPAKAQRHFQFLLHGAPKLPIWLTFHLVGSFSTCRKGEPILSRNPLPSSLFSIPSQDLWISTRFSIFLLGSLAFFTLLGISNHPLGSSSIQLNSFSRSLCLQWSPKQFFWIFTF